MNIELLKNLITFPSLSGDEADVLCYIKDIMKDLCDESYFDKAGNLICIKKSNIYLTIQK